MAVNMDKLMKQAQRMQAQLTQAQEELKTLTVEGASGGGMVKVTANGQGDILSITISPEVVNPEETEMLEDLILSAVKDAAGKGKALADKKMGGIAGGIPGLM